MAESRLESTKEWNVMDVLDHLITGERCLCPRCVGDNARLRDEFGPPTDPAAIRQPGEGGNDG